MLFSLNYNMEGCWSFIVLHATDESYNVSRVFSVFKVPLESFLTCMIFIQCWRFCVFSSLVALPTAIVLRICLGMYDVPRG